MINLSDLGEFGLIKRFSREFIKNIPDEYTGIGDDCAIFPLNKKEVLLVTTDMLIEDSHFIMNKISPYELGQKSLMVNLSDIAAMGGTPDSAYLSMGLTTGTDVKWIDDFFKGIKQVCNDYNVCLLGGDTTRSPDRLVINFAVLGKGSITEVKRRSTALPGDIICINDYVGDSGAGLQILLNDLPAGKDSKYLIRRHNCPRANVKEGKWLSLRKEVHAMMDVSDGIESDIHRIMESSNVGAEIDLDMVPLSDELKVMAAKYNWNAHEIGVSGGEDYCLLFTVEENKVAELMHNYEKEFKRPIYKIGRINDSGRDLTFMYENKVVGLIKHGWDHFR